MSFQAFDEHTLQVIVGTLDDTTGNTWQVILAPPSNGGRIDAITMSNQDTIAILVEFSIAQGGQPAMLGAVSVPAGAGSGVVPAVDALAALQVGAPGAVMINNGSVFQFRATTLPSAGTYVLALCVGGLF